MRIIFITFVSLLALGILLLMARIWGLGQNYPQYEHSFFSGPTPLIIVKANTIEKAKEALHLHPQAVLWIDVRTSKEKIPFVLSPERDRDFLRMKAEMQKNNPQTPIMTSNKLAEYPWDEIKTFYKNAVPLKDFYEQFPETRFVLNVVDNVHDVHIAVVEALKDLHPDKRTLIQSDALIIMTTIKEAKPEWVYGTSLPDLMRLLSFDSMFILPSTVFKGDVFIAPFTLKKRPAFTEDIIVEMRRRNKRIFLGPIENERQLKEAQQYKAEGLITTNLPELLRLLGQGPTQ